MVNSASPASPKPPAQQTTTSALRKRVEELEQHIQRKDSQILQLTESLQAAMARFDGIEFDKQSSTTLHANVQQLLRVQQDAASSYNDYENRVLALELESLNDRYRLMDIDELSAQNHDLRDQVLRLQHENMELSREVAESSLSSRRDVARIEIALEETLRQKLHSAYDEIREELYQGLDEKTKTMATQHGKLHDQLHHAVDHLALLDSQYGKVAKERHTYKLDADVLSGMTDMQARQNIALRRQVDHAALMVHAAQQQAQAAELRAQSAVARSMRDARLAAKALRGEGAAAAEGDGDEDSALGLTGGDQDAELSDLRRQVRHWRGRTERSRTQCEAWRSRSTLYEKACAQLQAALLTLQEQSKLTLPNGARQSLDSVWRQVAEVDHGARPFSAANAPHTAGREAVVNGLSLRASASSSLKQQGAFKDPAGGKEVDDAAAPDEDRSADSGEDGADAPKPVEAQQSAIGGSGGGLELEASLPTTTGKTAATQGAVLLGGTPSIGFRPLSSLQASRLFSRTPSMEHYQHHDELPQRPELSPHRVSHVGTVAHSGDDSDDSPSHARRPSSSSRPTSGPSSGSGIPPPHPSSPFHHQFRHHTTASSSRPASALPSPSSHHQQYKAGSNRHFGSSSYVGSSGHFGAISASGAARPASALPPRRSGGALRASLVPARPLSAAASAAATAGSRPLSAAAAAAAVAVARQAASSPRASWCFNGGIELSTSAQPPQQPQQEAPQQQDDDSGRLEDGHPGGDAFSYDGTMEQGARVAEPRMAVAAEPRMAVAADDSRAANNHHHRDPEVAGSGGVDVGSSGDGGLQHPAFLVDATHQAHEEGVGRDSSHQGSDVATDSGRASSSHAVMEAARVASTSDAAAWVPVSAVRPASAATAPRTGGSSTLWRRNQAASELYKPGVLFSSRVAVGVQNRGSSSSRPMSAVAGHAGSSRPISAVACLHTSHSWGHS